MIKTATRQVHRHPLCAHMQALITIFTLVFSTGRLGMIGVCYPTRQLASRPLDHINITAHRVGEEPIKYSFITPHPHLFLTALVVPSQPATCWKQSLFTSEPSVQRPLSLQLFRSPEFSSVTCTESSVWGQVENKNVIQLSGSVLGPHKHTHTHTHKILFNCVYCTR